MRVECPICDVELLGNDFVCPVCSKSFLYEVRENIREGSLTSEQWERQEHIDGQIEDLLDTASDGEIVYDIQDVADMRHKLIDICISKGKKEYNIYPWLLQTIEENEG